MAAVSGSHVIAVLHNSSGLELTAYPPGSTVTINVIRSSTQIATGTALIDGAGDGAINGGANDCWTGVTPDILPGDTVEVTGAGFDDTMVLQDTSAANAVQNLAGDIEVHGTAADPAGNPLGGGAQTNPPGVEARIISGSVFSNGKKAIRAGAGDPFSLSYDAPGSTHWTATFTGLSSGDKALALGAIETRGLFTNATLNETTISQSNSTPGPTPPCSAPLAQNAVTSSNHLMNVASAGTDLVVSGVSQDSNGVTVTLDDGHGHTLTSTATPAPATGKQTWQATFPASPNGIDALPDGTYTASGNYSLTAGGNLTGATLSILKDTVAPPAPFATPGAGTYTGAKSVTLSDVDSSAVVHWTIDPAAPSASSSTAQPINVSSSRTLRAIAIDAAGNKSPEGTFAYVINNPPAPPQPQPQSGGNNSQGSQGTVTTIIQQIPIAGGVSAGAVTAIVDLTPPTVTLTLPSGGARLAGSGITFTLSSDEPGLATVGGSIGQRGSSRLFKLRAASRTLTRSRSTQVTVRVPISSLKALRRALGQHRVVQIHLTIKAVDPAGNARTLTRTLRVRSA
jgi:hypothetical protein